MWKFTNKHVPNNTHEKISKFSRNITRHNVPYVSFYRDKGEVMFILVVWLACYSYGINR